MSRKNDLRQIDYLSSYFGVSRFNLREYIHELKRDFEGNPNLQFGRNGEIILGSEFLGFIQDVM